MAHRHHQQRPYSRQAKELCSRHAEGATTRVCLTSCNSRFEQLETWSDGRTCLRHQRYQGGSISPTSILVGLCYSSGASGEGVSLF